MKDKALRERLVRKKLEGKELTDDERGAWALAEREASVEGWHWSRGWPPATRPEGWRRGGMAGMAVAGWLG